MSDLDPERSPCPRADRESTSDATRESIAEARESNFRLVERSLRAVARSRALLERTKLS
jgi:hypothetical protein